MTLQDEMARAIYEAIRRNPEGYPKAVIHWALEFHKIWHEGEEEEGRTVMHGTWGAFKKALAEHADEIRAICTENE
jgi:hypothetical protein